MHQKNFIAELCRSVECRLYLELGIFSGSTIDAVRKACPACRCIGVDICDYRTDKTSEFVHLANDEFFQIFRGTADVIFIDANHDYEPVMRDFLNSLAHLSTGGTIILHDVDPGEARLLATTECSDAYKIIDYIRDVREDLNVVTLPIGKEGLAVVTRNTDRRVYNYDETGRIYSRNLVV